MSRFEEAIDAAIGAGAAVPVEALVDRIAEEVRDRQGAERAEVTITARVPRERTAPVSGIATHEHFTLLATAVATQYGTRRLLGVSAQGITACPCAQGLVRDAARGRLASQGFTPGQIDQVFTALPAACLLYTSPSPRDS